MIINGKEYQINRENAKVREFDRIYCELLKQILTEGELFENRTGINTLSIEGAYFKVHTGEEFPILESKKVMIKNALSEMLWIYQAQSNVVSWLRERGNNIWNEWEVDEDGIYRVYEPVICDEPDKKVPVRDLDGNIIIGKYATSKIPGRQIKEAKYFGPEYAGTIGTAYGWIMARYKRLQQILEILLKNPNDRRMVMSIWQDEFLRTAVLPSCVWSSEWKVSNGKLHGFVHQRSADTPLGLPFNVAQYAILQSMMAQVSGLEVGNLNWSIMDAHIYVNQIEGIKLQLERYEKMLKCEEYIRTTSDESIARKYNYLIGKKMILEPVKDTHMQEYRDLLEEIMIMELMVTKEKPSLVLADKKDFFSFSNEVNNDKEYLKQNITGNEDIKVLNYKSAPFIKMPIAQ